jgi:hypothetical protein
VNTSGERLFSLLTAMLGIAMVSVLVQSPNTAKVLTAGGNAWVGGVRAVMGK